MTFWVAGSVVGSAVIGGVLQSNAAQSAAQTQANAANNATAAQQGIYQNNQAVLQPFITGGQNSLTSFLNNMPNYTGTFTNQDLTANLAPNYQFMLNQGLGANSQNVNVGGGGSNVNTANQVFAQNYASNAYQNAYNNWYNTRQANVQNQLAPIQIGQNAASALAGVGPATGANIANTTVGAGTALASGQIGSANALAGGLGSVGNGALLASMMNGNANQNAANALNGVVNSGADLSGVYSSGSMPAYYSSLSDPRAKENIEFIGTLPSGIRVYDFDYKPEFKDEAGHGRYRGVMADEVEKIIPEAVVIGKNGYKMVNYGLIH
jgi:hypothetical protein